MTDTNSLLREIPQIEKLLNEDYIAPYLSIIGKSACTECIRTSVAKYREHLKKTGKGEINLLHNIIKQQLSIKSATRLQRVINGTGVIIHTNLGRAPLGEKIFESLKENLSGYCNLEFYIPEKKRGKRGGFAEELISSMTGAEDALIVNNNAASVFLILNEFAKGGETIVSRGELIQIGGGFRIPDIMAQSGTTLVEVGTTNITTVDDYKKGITDKTKMIFSAHRSNFKLEGFTENPSLVELSGLKNENIIFVRDMGSGNLVYDWMPGSFEQTVLSEISQGLDLICFSGDKLLGGCQAGIIAGKKEYIARLRKNPLMRILRVDKITYYILQETLLNYVNSQYRNTELWKVITQSRETILKKANKIIRLCNGNSSNAIEKIPTKATYGGGSMPGIEIDSYGLKLKIPGYSPDDLYDYFLNNIPPILGTIRENSFVIDLFTIFDKDIKDISKAIKELLAKK
ncbi:MAG TPA: L-seryl-tRNA(Sec) selenium transferase [Spirochaetota bacterium]|jgi:L-seryl-tRNA(Ser) seleniumtransferase|nr:L-seryl-tRNA(Sec) selenium transferase [Spirochaetota bacterium]HOK02566.1 L-seryl-tRNA(Sec) selenium transferase [Spirochaetota bacterium]HPP94508.1 L-seryl-tRNA(Sec) selenium transferase [Spirochaetota bacterium]